VVAKVAEGSHKGRPHNVSLANPFAIFGKEVFMATSTETKIPGPQDRPEASLRERFGSPEQSVPVADRGAAPPSVSLGPRQSLLKRAISFPAMLGAFLVVALFVPLRDFTLDPDVWWHIKVGQAILATHHWPTADTYSFTAPGAPWMAYEWVAETLLAAVQRAWGLKGLMGLDLVLGAAVVLALYALATLRSRNSKAAFVTCLLLLLLTAVSFTLRPQMLGYLFLVIILVILERFRQGRAGTLWLLPPLFLVWVNTHGSFVVGLFAFAVYGISGLIEMRWGGLESVRWTEAQRVRLGLAFAACLAALAFTPYGVRVAVYPLDMAFSQPINVASIQEWQPMAFNLPFGKFFLALLVGFLLAQIILRLTWQLAELTLFLAGLVAACLHARFLLIFVPFCAPILAVVLSRWIPPYDPGKDKYALNVFLMIAVAVGMVRFFPSREQLASRIAQHWPEKAVRYIEQHPPPRPMYNNYGYGGYLIYALDGRNKVFIDGRADIYERAGVLADYGKVAGVAPVALPLLRAYNVQSCLIERDETLATLLAASSQWQKVYADDLSALFVRKVVGDSGIQVGERGRY